MTTDFLDTKTKNTVRLLSIIKTTRCRPSPDPGTCCLGTLNLMEGNMKQSGPRCTSRGRHLIVRFQLPAYVVTASYEVTVVTVDGTVTRDIIEYVDEMHEVEV